MKTYALIVFLSFFVWGGIGASVQPLRPPKLPTLEQSYEQLLSVREFAFGGIGYAGETSKGEMACRAIGSATNTLHLFLGALTNGNAQAKLYALCAVHQLAPETFDARARFVISANPKSMTMEGCIMSRDWTSNVVAKIAKGSYDFYFKK